MKKRLLSFILLLSMGIAAAYAYDFSAVAPTGQTLYYSIISSGGTPEVSVTYPGSSSTVWSGYSMPTGSLTIPSAVTDGGTTYYVTSIGNMAFENCSSLTSVTIPNTITSIGQDAFAWCGSLTSVTIPNLVTSIGNTAFYGCSNLASVTIPNSVTSIGDYAFAGCSGLTSIIVSSGNTVYDSRSNCNAIIHTATNTLVAGCQNTTIPNSVTSIGGSAFFFCGWLTSVIFPNSVTSIGDYAFAGCSSLTSVTIPNSVTSIGEVAFTYCNSLTSVTIGNSVTSIGNYAFADCSSLTSITAKPTVAPSTGTDVFYNVPSSTPVYIPCGSTSSYTSRWGHFSNYIEVMYDSVHVTSADESMGTAAVVTQPTCTSPTATITATPNAGYIFTNWTSGSTVVSTSATYTFTVTANHTLTANFISNPVEALVAYYPFDGDANDYSGNGLHGTIIGNVTPAPDRFGNPNKAYRFPGNAFNYISVPDANPLHLNSFTLNAWVYTDDEDYGNGYLICKGRDIYDGSYYLIVNRVYAENQYGGNNGAGVAEIPTVGQWHMITGTVDGANARFYIDGVLMDEQTLSNNFSYNNTEPLTLGMHYYTGVPSYWTYPLRGVMDEVRIYNHVLTPQEIRNLYDASEISCNITESDLPYTDNFDSYTTSTTAKTGVEPSCWTLAHQYVAMTNEYKPMIYYGSSTAHSGNYSLILNKRGIYAMPLFSGDVSALQLSFYLKQTQTKYQLQVGVMTDLTNASSFVPVTTIDNSGTGYVQQTVDFSAYTGNGHYIAFRNILASGYTGDYSCNYIDDLTLSSATGCTYPDCSSGNCGNNQYLTSQEVYTAAQYLCGHTIIDPGNGATSLRPNDNITRAELAKIALLGLYDGAANVPDTLVSDHFPSIYPDLQDHSTFYYRWAKALLYLEYGDGVTPFDRDRSTFNPQGAIERCLVLKVLMETFNIAPYNGSSTASPFSDYSATDKHWAYAKKAAELGITLSGSTFRPYEMCTRAEAFMFLYRIMTSTAITRPTPVNTFDLTTSSFFIPNNLSATTLNAIRGVAYGNFQYEEKECFSNPGWMDMDFSIVYNSVFDELPDDFCPIKPLGSKVWNHTYNMYMNVVHNEFLNNDWLVFHMAGDKYLVYQKNGDTLVSLTDGNYNTLTQQSSTVYKIKTIGQVEYTFQKLISTQPIFYLTSVCNRFGDCININYATSGNYKRITSVTSGSGSGQRTYTFTYASNSDRLSSVTDPLNRTIRFYYNSSNRLNRFQDAKGNNTYYTYGTLDYEKDLLKQIQLPRGNIVNNNYHQRKLTSTQLNSDPATSVQQSINYANIGDQRYTSTVTEPMTSGSGSQSIVTHFTTNERGRVVRLYDNCNKDFTQYYEDANHPELPSRIVDNKLNATITYTYSNVGQVTQKTTSASGISFNEQLSYNNTNDITSYTDPNGYTTNYYYTSSGALSSITDAAGHTTSYTNNSHGRPTSIQNPQGVTTGLTYNSRGLVSQVSVPAASLSSSFAYDNAGRLTSSTDNNGNTTNYAYDANDNVTSITDAAGHTTSMTYDANDNMTRITNARGYHTNLTYDNNDFNTSQSFQGHTKSFTYYANGALHTMTTPNNNTLNFSYNNSGQITSTGYASYTYGNNGLLSSISKDNKAITYGYDGLGRVTSIAYDGKTVNYTYDNAGNVLTIKYPGNKTVTYAYNNINQMTSVTDWNNHTTNYSYRNDGLLNYVQYPNNVRTTYCYDNTGRCTGQVTKRNSGNGTVIAQYTYTLDNNGNHLTESVTEPYTTYPAAVAQTINYTYGNDNRLLTAGDKSFGYDNNGNTTTKTGRSMTYDVLNNLTGVSGNFSASYTYDGLGNRRSATRNGSTTKYVLNLLAGNPTVLMETSSSGTAQKYYIYGADGLVSRIGSNGSTTHYYVSDFRGSVVAMTDATTSANVTHQYQYDEFGSLLQSQETDANPFRYVGKYGVMYEDDELYFMRARYYDPTVGRFLSEDPLWNTNLYPYADNNPIIGIDPSGELSEELQLVGMQFWETAGSLSDGLSQMPTLGSMWLTEILPELAMEWSIGYVEDSKKLNELLLQEAQLRAAKSNDFWDWVKVYGYETAIGFNDIWINDNTRTAFLFCLYTYGGANFGGMDARGAINYGLKKSGKSLIKKKVIDFFLGDSNNN